MLIVGSASISTPPSKYDLLTSEDGQTWQSSPPLPVDFGGAGLSSGLSCDPVVFAGANQSKR